MIILIVIILLITSMVLLFISDKKIGALVVLLICASILLTDLLIIPNNSLQDVSRDKPTIAKVISTIQTYFNDSNQKIEGYIITDVKLANIGYDINYLKVKAGTINNDTKEVELSYEVEDNFLTLIGGKGRFRRSKMKVDVIINVKKLEDNKFDIKIDYK